jgi:hypothetical protein
LNLRSELAKRTFDAGIAWLRSRSLAEHGEEAPPVIPNRPKLPDRWPAPHERIDFEGWRYRCNVQGLYHAWPIEPHLIDLHFRSWMTLADGVIQRMMTSLDRRGGPLLTGMLIAVGHIGDAPDRIFFPDGIAVPMSYSTPDDFEFVPIVALTAPDPLRTLLVEMIRCHGYSGRLSEAEYFAMAGEGPSPEEGLTRYHPPGWVQPIGQFESAFASSDSGRRAKTFLGSGYIAEPDYPTFAVNSGMVSQDERWPAMLKRDSLLGASPTVSAKTADSGTE